MTESEKEPIITQHYDAELSRALHCITFRKLLENFADECTDWENSVLQC
jgi:hypothetical protein